MTSVTVPVVFNRW